MAEELVLSITEDKDTKYKELIPQIIALTEGEPNAVANLANVAAALMQSFGHLWVGFYLVEGEELVLGPFQGPIACTRIMHGKGVCGSAWAEKRTILVDNVDEFPGHIACSSDSKSEIVVPIVNSDGAVLGVLDVDSASLNTFELVDQIHLEKLCAHISNLI